MKKIISLLLILTIFALCGCGQDVPPETTVLNAPTEPPVQEIPFAQEPDLRKYPGTQLQFFSLLAEDDPEAAAVTQAAAVFSRQTGAEVTVTWLGGDEAALIQALAAGSGADIFEISGIGLQNVGASYALDLTELAGASDYESHSYEALRGQVAQRCGYLAGIPWRLYLTGVYYNREAFADCAIDQAPKTWEEFLAACQALVTGGYAPLTMDAENAYIPLELHLERSLGAERATELLSSGSWEKDAQAMQAVGQLCAFVADGYLMKGCPADYPAGQNKLALSNAAMAAGSNRLCGQVEDTALVEISWGVFAWPGDGAGTGTAVDADVLAVNKASPNAQAAFDFILLLSTGEFDQLRADLSGGIPADPANVSPIFGAEEALAAADSRSLGLPDSKNNSRILKLWQGKYSVPAPAE